MKLFCGDLVVRKELKTWKKRQKDFIHLGKVALPRSLNAAECTETKLHMFTDASFNGYRVKWYLPLQRQQSTT